METQINIERGVATTPTSSSSTSLVPSLLPWSRVADCYCVCPKNNQKLLGSRFVYTKAVARLKIGKSERRDLSEINK